MTYFTGFPKVQYTFDDELVFTTNLTAYAEVLDSVRISSSFYQDYHIMNDERPDHVAMKFYNDPQLHWVMYLMNPKLREQGWPLSQLELTTKVQKDHPNTVLVIHDDSITSLLSVGQVIKGDQSEAVGTILHKNLDLGQVTVETDGTFVAGEMLIDIENTTTPYTEFVIYETVAEHLAAHHYTLNGERIDVNPYQPVTFTGIVKVTINDFYFENNESLKQIRVIKPNSINSVVSAFNQAIRS